ncbi:MAG TPA: polysaccharide deacetylase family protein [Sediminibacterium sp.]|nr:polysaccharide deacetylase family protein [Sediminibacterium sp.]
MKHLIGVRVLSGLVFICSCQPREAAMEVSGDSGMQVKTNTAASANQLTDKPFVYDSSRQYIYISFDDGPQRGTMESYAICKDLDIKATYFLVAVHVKGRSDGRRIVNTLQNSYPAFITANHSYYHAKGRYDSFYRHPNGAFQDFQKAQDTIRPLNKKLLRLPGNNAWALKDTMRASRLVRPVTRKLDSAGYNILGWDSEWHFNPKDARPVQSAEKMAQHIKSLLDSNQTFTRNHLVLLAHDRMFQRPSDQDSLRKMLQILKQNPRYIFETLDHYPGLKR